MKMELSSSRYSFSASILGFYFYYCVFSLMLTIMLMLPSSVVNAAVICPPEADYAPCTCDEVLPTYIYLDCSAQNLGDFKMNDILKVFLTTPDVSPVGAMRLDFNPLTRVPIQIKSFDKLVEVSINNNTIFSVVSGAFNFPNATNPLRNLSFHRTPLSTIAPGAFTGDGYGDGTRINLSFNKLTHFESTVFQSVLEKLAPYGGAPNAYVDIESNPNMECDCHLAWLIRDNRHLLPAVRLGKCSNGTTFEQLDPNGFADCASFVCPLGYDGDYADPLSGGCSNNFYRCQNNVSYSNSCSINQVFNPETRRCDVVANVPGCQMKR